VAKKEEIKKSSEEIKNTIPVTKIQKNDA